MDEIRSFGKKLQQDGAATLAVGAAVIACGGIALYTAHKNGLFAQSTPIKLIEVASEAKGNVSWSRIEKEVQKVKLFEGVDFDTDEEGNTALMLACKNGNKRLAQLLLKNGASETTTNNSGWNSLHMSALADSYELVELLVATIVGTTPTEEYTKWINATNPNNGWTVFHIACSKNNEKACALLARLGADLHAATAAGETPLIIASCNGSLTLVKELLQNGADVNAKTTSHRESALVLACRNGHAEIAKLLIEKGAEVNIHIFNGVTALHYASMSGNTEIMQLLISKGADVNAVKSDGFTPLHCSVVKGHPDGVRLLLQNGANAQAETKFGRTALHEAAYVGNLEVVKQLLENGADPNYGDHDGLTPLHTSAQMHGIRINPTGKFAEISAALIKAGADVNSKDDFNCTPLHMAACAGEKALPITEILLENGGDVTATSLQDWTPLRTAYSIEGNEKMIAAMERKVAVTHPNFLETFDRKKKKSTSDTSRPIGAEKRLTPEQRFEVLKGNPTLEGIAQRITEGRSKKIVVLSGAGISVSAGIPDFRSPHTGLYSAEMKEDLGLSATASVFDLQQIMVDPYPFAQVTKRIFYPVVQGKIKPTASHYFVKLLNDKGLLLRNYTQNVDMLESIAGIPTERLVECHGSFSHAHCLKCNEEVKDMSTYWSDIAADLIPSCGKCGGVIRPDVVFFGEALPPSFSDTKQEDFKECDLLIVMGTSLQVYPFAGLVSEPKVTTPRLLLNKNSVSVWRRVTGDEAPSSIGNYRDVAYIGECDKGVIELCELLGWKEDLEKLRQTS